MILFNSITGSIRNETRSFFTLDRYDKSSMRVVLSKSRNIRIHSTVSDTEMSISCDSGVRRGAFSLKKRKKLIKRRIRHFLTAFGIGWFPWPCFTIQTSRGTKTNPLATANRNTYLFFNGRWPFRVVRLNGKTVTAKLTESVNRWRR